MSPLLEDNAERTVYVKFEGNVITSVKLTQLKKVTEASFTANGTSGEAQYLLGGDDAPARAADSLDSYRSLDSANTLLYGFVLDSGITSLRLDLRITGNYKVSVAKADGVFQQVAEVSSDSTNQRIYLDTAGKFSAGEAWYVKVELLEPNSDKAVRLYSVRLFTNLASDFLIERYEREREADFTLTPVLGEAKEDSRFWTSDPNSAEYRLLDMALSNHEDHIFKNGNLNMRCLQTSDSVLVYKLDFSESNAAFWLEPEDGLAGFDITQGITKLRVDVDIAENYKIEISSDNGETWTSVAASALPSNYGGGATNRKKQPVNLTEAYLANPVIYMRISCPVQTNYNGADQRSVLLLQLTEHKMNSKNYQPTWSSLNARELPSWYDESKLGIFIHWGIYSVPAYAPRRSEVSETGLAYAEWYGWQVAEGFGPYADFHRRHYPGKSYHDLAPEWHAELFSPADWAKRIAGSGAKYCVLTTKHHDVFCLWDSDYSRQWNARKIGPKRDIVSELMTALDAENIRRGLYYSLLEWDEPDMHPMRSVFFGRSETITIKDGKLDAGEFAHIYFIDWDHVRARRRQVNVAVMGITGEVGDRKYNGGKVVDTLRKYTEEEKAYDSHFDLAAGPVFMLYPADVRMRKQNFLYFFKKGLDAATQRQYNTNKVEIFF